MKKINLLGAAVLALSSSFAHAGGYLGLNIGQADIDIDGFDKSFSYSVTGGYKFNKYFALEASLLQLGEFDDNIAPVWTLDFDGFNTAAVGILPINEQFNLFAKAGIFMWNAQLSEAGFGTIGETDGTDINIGIGASYSFSKNWEASAQYQSFTLDDTDASNLSIGIQYNF